LSLPEKIKRKFRNTPGQSHYYTTSTDHRKPYFKDERVCQALADSLTTTHPAPPIGGVPIAGPITAPVPKFDDNINDLVNGKGKWKDRDSRETHQREYDTDIYGD
jgi:hypothetical protein